jgi:hypothetical protein
MDTCQSLAVACEHFVGVVAPPITAILGATTDRLVTCQEDLHWISSHASVTNVLAAGSFILILAICYYIRQVRVDIRQLHARIDLQESQLTTGSGNSENTRIDGPSNGHSLGQTDGAVLQLARGVDADEKCEVDATPTNGHPVGQSIGNVAKPRKVRAHEGPQEKPAAARSPRPPARVLGRSDRELRNPPCTRKAYSQSELIESESLTYVRSLPFFLYLPALRSVVADIVRLDSLPLTSLQSPASILSHLVVCASYKAWF